MRLETEYWQLLEVPKQEKQEPVLNYVLRACSIMEKSQRSSESNEKVRRISEDEERKRTNAERLNGKTIIEGLQHHLLEVT